MEYVKFIGNLFVALTLFVVLASIVIVYSSGRGLVMGLIHLFRGQSSMSAIKA